MREFHCAVTRAALRHLENDASGSGSTRVVTLPLPQLQSSTGLGAAELHHVLRGPVLQQADHRLLRRRRAELRASVVLPPHPRDHQEHLGALAEASEHFKGDSEQNPAHRQTIPERP